MAERRGGGYGAIVISVVSSMLELLELKTLRLTCLQRAKLFRETTESDEREAGVEQPEPAALFLGRHTVSQSVSQQGVPRVRSLRTRVVDADDMMNIFSGRLHGNDIHSELQGIPR